MGPWLMGVADLGLGWGQAWCAAGGGGRGGAYGALRVHTPLFRVRWRGVGQPGVQQAAFDGLLHTRQGYWGGGRLGRH